jgi:hypothetical protein
MKPLVPWLGHRAEGLIAMVARMNRVEDAARLAMADLGADAAKPAAMPGMTYSLKLGLVLVSLTVTGLIAVNFL